MEDPLLRDWKPKLVLMGWLATISPTAWGQDSLEIPLPEQEYQWTASIEPHSFVLGPALSGTLERRLSDPHAVSGTMVLGQARGEGMVQLHAQYRYYVIGDFDAGVHLAGMLSGFNANYYTDEGGAAVRALAGAKYIFPFPLSAEMQLGIGVSTVQHINWPFYVSLKVGYAF